MATKKIDEEEDRQEDGQGSTKAKSRRRSTKAAKKAARQGSIKVLRRSLRENPTRKAGPLDIQRAGLLFCRGRRARRMPRLTPEIAPFPLGVLQPVDQNPVAC